MILDLVYLDRGLKLKNIKPKLNCFAFHQMKGNNFSLKIRLHLPCFWVKSAGSNNIKKQMLGQGDLTQNDPVMASAVTLAGRNL